MESLLVGLVDAIGSLGYIGLIIMMALESTFIPLPSEFILPPAGYLVYQGKMDFFIVLFCGVLGSILGASFNYWLGARYGKRVILKILHWFHMKADHYYAAERFFQKHGEVSTFVGRLLLGIRHFISFPAGVAKMKIASFLFYTGIGAAIWSVILIGLGYYVGEKQDLIHEYYKEIGIGLLLFCVLVIGGYILWHKKHKK